MTKSVDMLESQPTIRLQIELFIFIPTDLCTEKVLIQHVKFIHYFTDG